MSLPPPSALLALTLLGSGCAGESPAPEDGIPEVAATDTAPSLDSDSDTGASSSEPVPGVTSVSFSHTRGLYDAPFELTLERSEGMGTIRYSLDASDPLGEGGLDYDGPIGVETTAVVRVAVEIGGSAIFDETHTFLFPADVPAQVAPEGSPEEWWLEEDGGPYPADYEMDPEIYEATDYADAFPDLFSSLPIVALALDADDLWGDEGIHEHPQERGEDWERGASFEIINLGEGLDDVGLRCGARIQGGASRRADRTPKKSFRVLFKSDYGASKLEAPLYEGSPVERFDTLVLRSRYNRSWANWQDSQRSRSQYVRERFGLDTHREMGGLSGHGRPVHVFLNGLYWGVYLIEERPDASFHSEHVGGEKNEWDVLNSGEATDGDRESWEEMMAAAAEVGAGTEGAWDALEPHLDREAFADYMLLNLSMGNIDWPEKNWYAARQRSEEGRWRFLIWDFELTMSEIDDDHTGVDDADTPGELFQHLRAEEEFNVLFGDRAHLHMSEGGVLSADANLERWAALTDAVVPAVFAESARWGDHWRDARGDETELYTYTDHWLDENERMTEDYFPSRTETFLEILVAAGLYPSTAAPTADLASGEVEPDDEVTLSAEAPIYYTLDGTDPREPGGALSADASLYEAPVAIGDGAELRARVLDGDDWSALLTRAWTPL